MDPTQLCCTEERVTRQTIINRKIAEDKLIRRSTRDPNAHGLDRHDLTVLLKKITKNDSSTKILKIKEHIQADINSSVFDVIIQALEKNRVCQCLYIQNLSRAIGDEQIHALIEVLKKKMIWGLNIGETYEVSLKGWMYFCDKLKETNITHLYVSEHTIPIDLKNEMRANIRENRKKHDLHCALKNVRIIERCTNMWWNPINGVKELKPPPPPKPAEPTLGAVPLAPIVLSPSYTAYWQEGIGEGGEKPWKFKCTCGEECSSYENYRYHPIGRMFECSNPACCLWSHVNCVLDPSITDKELETRKDLFCGACKTKSRRMAKYTGLNIIEMNTVSSKGEGRRPAPTAELLEDEKPWKFKCKCGEKCSSYELPNNHPAGQWYECSRCEIWSHVQCNLGNKTPDEVAAMPEVFCFSCFTAARRNRKRSLSSSTGELEVPDLLAAPTIATTTATTTSPLEFLAQAVVTIESTESSTGTQQDTSCMSAATMVPSCVSSTSSAAATTVVAPQAVTDVTAISVSTLSPQIATVAEVAQSVGVSVVTEVSPTNFNHALKNDTTDLYDCQTSMEYETTSAKPFSQPIE